MDSGSSRLSGIVIDPNNEPVRGALCQLLPGEAPVRFGSAVPRRALTETSAVRSVETDGQGRFDLAAGDGFWRLRVEVEDGP